MQVDHGQTVRIAADGSPDGSAATAVDGGWTLPAGAVRIEHDLEVVAVYRHGWTSWSPTGWVPIGDAPLRIVGDPERRVTADDARNDTPDRHEGNGLVAVELADGRVLLLGALGLGVPRVGADASALWARTERDGDGWFLALGDEATVFDAYAARLGERFGRPPGLGGVETVWCSWYSFFEDIDADRIGESVDALGDLPVDVVQIDDGWEDLVGDWTPNAGFPDGLAPLAGRIAARGSRPGLWLAPFICLPGSRLAAEHPDWLVQDRAGGPLVAGHNWDSHYWALDTTKPAVQEHLRRVFTDVAGWGFRYCKLDFLSAAALDGVREQDLDREQVYREAVQLVREVVGPDVFLLGCGAPVLPSLGVFDALRAGPDTATIWSSEHTVPDPSHEGGLNGMIGPVERLWLSGLVTVDPDVASFRATDPVATDPSVTAASLTAAQRALVADLGRVCRFRTTSDPAQWLGDDERAALRDFLARRPEVRRTARYRYEVDGRPVDLGPAVAEARVGREDLREDG